MENASRATWLLHVDYFIKLTDSGEWKEFIARNKRISPAPLYPR
jgi:hypothetical protein